VWPACCRTASAAAAAGTHAAQVPLQAWHSLPGRTAATAMDNTCQRVCSSDCTLATVAELWRGNRRVQHIESCQLHHTLCWCSAVASAAAAIIVNCLNIMPALQKLLPLFLQGMDVLSLPLVRVSCCAGLAAPAELLSSWAQQHPAARTYSSDLRCAEVAVP
jgi:hypothetical protein